MINSSQFEESWKRVKELTGWEKNKELADFLGISGSSVSGTKGRGNFPIEWAYKIAKGYNGSVKWILEGRGPMRPDAHPNGAQPGPAAERPAAIEDDFDALGMAEGMGLLAKIYSSGDNIYIRAINANLLAFANTVETKAKAIILEKTIQQMQVQMLQMQEQINELKQEVLRLRNENGALKKELRSRGWSSEPGAATG